VQTLLTTTSVSTIATNDAPEQRVDSLARRTGALFQGITLSQMIRRALVAGAIAHGDLLRRVVARIDERDGVYGLDTIGAPFAPGFDLESPLQIGRGRRGVVADRSRVVGGESAWRDIRFP